LAITLRQQERELTPPAPAPHYQPSLAGLHGVLTTGQQASRIRINEGIEIDNNGVVDIPDAFAEALMDSFDDNLTR
jgi:hypothetical protein